MNRRVFLLGSAATLGLGPNIGKVELPLDENMRDGFVELTFPKRQEVARLVEVDLPGVFGVPKELLMADWPAETIDPVKVDEAWDSAFGNPE